jgi:hypothetical protein
MSVKLNIILMLLVGLFLFSGYLAFFPPTISTQTTTENIEIQGLVKDL